MGGEMIEVTSKAAEKFKALMQRKECPATHFVKISIKGGGCSGFAYDIDFVAEAENKDKTWEVDDVKFTTDPKSYLYLVGTTLDYVDDLMESGFKFINPNATGSCGCGKSVSF